MTPGIYTLGDFQITAADTAIGDVIDGLAGVSAIDAQLRFAYGSGGTTAKAFLQSSLDQGTTWFDLWCFAAATASKTRLRSLIPVAGEVTPSDGALADDTIAAGIVLGDRFRLKLVSAGIYAGNTLLSARIHAR
jgi:hypothetical protein